MKTVTLASIRTCCAHCGKSVAAITHLFHLGSSDNPHTRIRYDAALYHNVDQQKNFCNAHCSTAHGITKKNFVPGVD